MISIQQFKNKFLQLWQIELVRCYERDQSVESIPPVSPVFAGTDISGQSIHSQLHGRALRMLKHYQLEGSLTATIKSLKLVVFILFVLAVFIGVGLAQVVDTNASRVLSLPWVLFALLGIHFIMYFAWLLMLFAKPGQRGFLGAFIQQGLQLFNRAPKAKYAIHSLGHTLNHYRLAKPIFAMLTHVYWLILLSTAALSLSLLFLFQSYSFSWETTVLNLPSMNRLSQWLGGSLSWLGLTLPSVTALQAASPETQAQVGRWLIGMVVVYGSGLRFITVFVMAMVIAIRGRSLEVDKSQPGLSNLIAVLLRGSAQSIDKDNAIAGQIKQVQQPRSGHGDYWLQLEHAHFVQPDLTAGYMSLGVVATIADVERLTVKFNRQPAASMLITIDNQLTPDRGNMRLLRGLLALSAELHCYLVANEGAFTESWLTALQAFVTEQNAGNGVRISQAEPDNDK